MAVNDVLMSDVFGTNAVFCLGNAIPAAITGNAAKVAIIVLPEAQAKADLSATKYIKSSYVAADYDGATDFIRLVLACAIAYASLNSKASPTLNKRKFDVADFGLSLDNGNFETGVTFIASSLNVTTYTITNTVSSAYDPSLNNIS